MPMASHSALSYTWARGHERRERIRNLCFQSVVLAVAAWNMYTSAGAYQDLNNGPCNPGPLPTVPEAPSHPCPAVAPSPAPLPAPSPSPIYTPSPSPSPPYSPSPASAPVPDSGLKNGPVLDGLWLNPRPLALLWPTTRCEVSSSASCLPVREHNVQVVKWCLFLAHLEAEHVWELVGEVLGCVGQVSGGADVGRGLHQVAAAQGK